MHFGAVAEPPLHKLPLACARLYERWGQCVLFEEFTRLAETRLAQNSLGYLEIAQLTLT